MIEVDKNLLSKTRPNFARYEGTDTNNPFNPNRSVYAEFERTAENLWTYRWGAVGFPQAGENDQLEEEAITALLSVIIKKGYRLVDESEIPITETAGQLAIGLHDWLRSR